MKQAQGTVQKVFIKELPSPDKYGNTHRASFTLKGVDGFFNLGAMKGRPYIGSIKKELKEGDTIAFFYEENGNYRNVKKQTIVLSQPSDQPQKGSSGQGSQSFSSRSGYSNIGMAVGASINQAIALLQPTIKKETDISLKKIEDLAIQLYLMAEDLKQRAEDGNIAAAQLEEEKQHEQANNDLEDDLPF
jgi:hypothetical protein